MTTTTSLKTVENMTAEEIAEATAQYDMWMWLSCQKWSSFAQSLDQWYIDKGSFTPKQMAAAKSMRAKCEARNK